MLRHTTVLWRLSRRWGGVNTDYHVNEMLKTSEEGIARKEALFTRKGSTLYAICAVFPDDQLVLKGIKASDGATITLLGVGDLDWKQSGGNLVITMPKLNPSKMPCSHAWTFKVSDIED